MTWNTLGAWFEEAYIVSAHILLLGFNRTPANGKGCRKTERCT